MRSIKLRILQVSGIVALAILTAGSLAGAASASSAGNAAAGKYCYTVIAKIHPPAPASGVIKRGCYSTASKAALAESEIAATDVPLVTFYQNANYGGTNDTIYGHNGNCDSSGYGLGNLSYENSFVIGGISSYKTHSSCSGQKTYKQTGYSYLCKTVYHTYNVGYVGVLCNDDLNSMKVWNSG